MLLGCSTEEIKQALSSGGLGLAHSGNVPAEDGLVAPVSVICSVHMSQNLLFHLGQIPVGSVGWPLAFCWIRIDPHRAGESPGHDL